MTEDETFSSAICTWHAHAYIPMYALNLQTWGTAGQNSLAPKADDDPAAAVKCRAFQGLAVVVP